MMEESAAAATAKRQEKNRQFKDDLSYYYMQ